MNYEKQNNLTCYFTRRQLALSRKLFKVISNNMSPQKAGISIYLIIEDWIENERSLCMMDIARNENSHFSINDLILKYYIEHGFPPFVISTLMELKPGTLYTRINRLHNKK